MIAASHPGPAVAVTVVTVILAVGVGVDPARIVLVGAAMLAGQLSIGWSNDWIDADRDSAVARPDKPIASGLVSRSAVRGAAIAAAVVAVPVSLLLGPLAALVNIIGIASGWSYNAWLKRTPASGVPYLITFGTLPLFVTLSLAEPRPAVWWAIVVGALLGFGAHFANVLPDLDDDARTGVRGLPHILGRRPSAVVAFVSLAIVSLIASVGIATSEPGLIVVAVIGLVVGVAIAIAGTTLALTRPPTRLLFQLIIASAVVDVILLTTAGSSLVGR
ncbi:4-hydroxybenzoate polyprenyltransferase [Agreia bicolorata]|uniref:4-hydroxybenzoate polyprenyltransferase n=1 Tax=Agreia bicolorata TaxID=110935 RepID=A0A1T4YIJ8_9MICO|nr:UbiA family prenyltransferase [Agreia bicolorata]SKB01619.1 4-hydroxybenzoate polyprenyltransferase [Agreia bicolorata]